MTQGTVAHWIGAALARDAGVRTVFGVVGSGNFHLTNALTEHGARFIPARHEGGAAVMADAYARVSGELGILTVHQGPGLTNALTGLTEAAKSRTPLLVLAAEATQPTSNFYVDQAALAAAIGVLPDRVTAASTVAQRPQARLPHRADRAPHGPAQPPARRPGPAAPRHPACPPSRSGPGSAPRPRPSRR